MLIAGMGDFHLRPTNPVCRIDDYYETMLQKFGTILKWCDDHNVPILIQPGDFFHSATMPHKVVARIMNLLLRHTVQVVGVYGQHDLRFHSLDTSNTPLSVLEEAGAVKRLFPGEALQIQNTNIWGSSWGEAFPTDFVEGMFNVAVAHRMVIDDEKLWHDQKNFDRAMPLLRQSKYDLIVTGDNHHAFYARHNNRYLINCGSLTRANADQGDHRPCFYVMDTESGVLSRKLLPVRPFTEVSIVEAHEDKKRDRAELAAFIDTLSTGETFSFDFKRNVFNALEESKTTKELYRMVENIFGAVDILIENNTRASQRGLTRVIAQERADGNGKSSETARQLARINSGGQAGAGPVPGGAAEYPEAPL